MIIRPRVAVFLSSLPECLVPPPERGSALNREWVKDRPAGS